MRAQQLRDIARRRHASPLRARFEARRIDPHQAHGVLLRRRAIVLRLSDETLHALLGILGELALHQTGEQP